MAETSGGLPVETTDSATNEGALSGATTINVGNQKITTKGGLQGGALLKAMQDEYQSRMADSPMNRLGGFLESMKDAVAITSRDPGSAMAARDQEKRLKEESLFQMRAQMAALKGQMDQNAVIQNQLFGGPAPAGGAQAAPTAGGTQAAPADAAAASGIEAANTASNGLLGAVTDPNLRRQIGLQYMTNPDAAMKQLNAHFAEIAKMPEVQKDVNFLVKSGLDPKLALQVGLLKVVGAGAFAPHDMRTATGTVQNTPLSAAGAMVNTPTTAKPPAGAPAPAPVVPRPAVAPSATPAPTAAAPSATPAALTQTAAAPRVTPAAAPAPTAATPAQTVAPGATPAAPVVTAPNAGFHPGSTEDLALRKAAAEAEIARQTHKENLAADTAAEADKASNKIYGEEFAKVPQEKERASNTIAAADRVIQLADDPTYKKLMGYFNGGNKAASLLVGVLNNVPGHLFDKDRMESAMTSLGFNEAERTKFNQLKTDAASLGIEYTANMFKGARLGIGLEKLGSTGKGVSSDFTPATNKLFAQVTKNNAEFVLNGHRTFRDQWAPEHPGKTWGDFIQSREYDAMLDNHLANQRALTAGTPVRVERLSPEAAREAARTGSPTPPRTSILDQYRRRPN